jgi:transcriptional regulator with XRE-family HTH domain
MIADGAHLRSARGALGWSQAELADAAGVSRPTVDRVERENAAFAKAGSRTLRALEQALLMRGVELQFIGDGTRVVQWRLVPAA